MNIIVCIKQVPSSNEVRLDPVTKTIIRDGSQSVINPFDAFALEEAVRLKERLGGTVSVLSMGIPAAEALLRDAMSRGADRALLLSDRAFAGADTLATSYALSVGVRKLGGFRLIFCGKMAIDGDTAQIGPELAEHLGIPHVTNVYEIVEASESEVLCCRNMDGLRQLICVSTPAVLTIAKDINQPRMPSITGVRSAMTAPLEVMDTVAAGVERAWCGLDGSPTQVLSVEVPKRSSECIFLSGDMHEQVSALKKLIREEL